MTGYEVDRGFWWVCGGQTNLTTNCVDIFAPGSGSTTYTVKTWYRDANNALQSVSTTYIVTAPVAGPATQYWWGTSTGISQTNCAAPNPSGLKKDLLSTAPSGTDTGWTNSARHPTWGTPGTARRRT